MHPSYTPIKRKTDMPTRFFEFTAAYEIDELSDDAKKTAIREYQYDFQDIEIACDGDWFFGFSKEEWEKLKSDPNSNIGESDEQPDFILEWDKIRELYLEKGGGFEIENLRVAEGKEEIFFKILGIDPETLEDERVSYEIKVRVNRYPHRGTKNVLVFHYDERDFDDHRIPISLKEVSERFDKIFIERAREAIKETYIDMASDEYVMEELRAREYLFLKDGKVGRLKWTSARDVLAVPNFIGSIDGCREVMKKSLIEDENTESTEMEEK